MGTVSYRAIVASGESDRWVQHTHEVLENLNALLSGMVGAESSSRGFELTGEESYLESYRAGKESAAQAEKTVRDLTVDNPAQQNRLSSLDTLIARKNRFEDKMIALRQASGPEAAQDALRNGSGQPIMDEVQDLVRAMQNEELRLLVLRNVDAQRRLNQTRLVLFLGTMLGVLIALGAGWIAHRDHVARQLAEDARREGEERFGSLANNISQLAWMADEKGYIFWYNDRWFDYTGTTLAEMAGWGWQKVHHPDYVQSVVDKISQCFKTGEIWEDTFPLRGRDGHYRMFLSRAVPIRDARGKVLRWFGTNTDITEQKRAEDALRLSEERVTLLIQGVKDYAIFMLDPAGLVATWNEGAQRIKGYAAEEIVGQHFSKFYTPEALAEGTPSRELKTAVEQGHSEEEGWRVRKDGSRFWANVVITALRDKTGLLRGFGEVTRDITSRKEAESRLQSVTTLLSIATEAAKMGVWEWDPVSNVVICNQTMDEIYGDSPAVAKRDGTSLVQGRYERFAESIHPEDLAEVEAKLKQVIAQKNQDSNEFRIIWPDGSIRNISAVERAILDETGKVIRLVGVNTDITDRRAIQDELFAEKERAQVTLNSIGDAVICTDLAGNVTFLNPVAERMTGWSWRDAAGRAMAEVFRIMDSTTRETIPNPMDLAMVQNQTLGLPPNCVLLQRDGAETPIEDSVSPIHDRQGKVTGAVIVFRDVSEARKMTQQMTYSAQHDFLTGLPNRMLLNDRVNQAIALAPRHKRKVAVLFLDLDGFKRINDSLGHPTGDKLLQSVARRLADCLRDSDTVSRQGGDEFVVLLSEIEQAEDAAISAKRMLQAIAASHSIDGHDLHVTTSIGISVHPDDGLDGDTLIKNADTAMYHAKGNGRQSYQFFKQAMNIRVVERQSIEESLRRALERQEFAVHYQPKVNLKTGEVTGAEALLRWMHPARGLVLPAEFLAVAEDCGLILPIGNWILREACRQARAWLDAGLQLTTIAVNISAIEFRYKHFLEGVFDILAQTGLDPGFLELEVTEGVLMRSAESTESILKALRARGIKVAIDDFGTGYSSLSYLTRFPIDAIKIDHSFVRQITLAPDDAAVVLATISMGRTLKIRVVAEGVETQEEAAFLRAHQCEEAQGNYFSRPVVAAQFAKLITAGDSKAIYILD
jgi:diguanylate cyclase (GGDEF)-like protein/PAS domain S-box-containing protein